MKRRVSFLILLSAVTFLAVGQSLPDAYHFSSDGVKLIRGGLPSTDLYDEAVVDTLFLEFAQSNYWTLLENNYEDKIDIPATLTYKGDVYDTVGVRFRGQTSYMQVNGDKKSFNITLDYQVDGQDIDGYETLNLINGYQDPSFMREVIYFNIARNHIPASKGNFVILFINGQNWGLYSNIQQLDGEHVEEWYMDKESTRWRGEATSSGTGSGPGGGGPGGGGPGGGGSLFGAGTSTLNYNGPDTTDYQENYTLKKSYKANPWEDLVRACDLLNNTPSASLVDSLSQAFDIDGALWFLAHEILFTDEDSYVNKGGMDYYIYFDEATGRLVPQVYDGNSSISLSKATQWSPFYNETDADYAMQNKLFAVPELRQRYLAHVRTILDESFGSTVVNPIIESYENTIDLHVQNDPKKLYTYNDFTSEIADVKNFFANRLNYVGTNTEVNVESPAISSVDFYEDASIPESIVVSCQASHTDGIANLYLYYGTGLMGKFSKMEMYDDGQHNDGVANDGVYGNTIPAQSYGAWVRFYVEAVAANITGTRAYSPVGAEHDVYIKQIGVSTVASDVVINELMASNSVSVADQDGEYDDWVELYNNSSSAIDLSGYFLSDDMMELDKWEIPSGTSIAGNGYLIIWADKDEEQTGLHTNFKLSADGEGVYLTTPDIEIADQVVFDAQVSDMAYARVPNGTGDFQWQQHTHNGNNATVSVVEVEAENNDLLLYPNPANSLITLRSSNSSAEKVQVFSSVGSLIYEGECMVQTTIDISRFATGLYIVKVGTQSERLLIAR